MQQQHVQFCMHIDAVPVQVLREAYGHTEHIELIPEGSRTHVNRGNRYRGGCRGEPNAIFLFSPFDVRDHCMSVLSLCDRKEYVDAYIDYMFNRAVEKQYEAFSRGFLKVCGGRVLVSCLKRNTIIIKQSSPVHAEHIQIG